MSKQHLNTFAIETRLLKSRCLAERTSNIAGFLIHIAYSPTRQHIWAAPRFECARTPVHNRCEIADCMIVVDLSARGHRLPGWTGVNVPLSIEGELFPRKGSVFALRLVDNRNVRQRSIIVFAAPTSACRIARVASTSTITPTLTSTK